MQQFKRGKEYVAPGLFGPDYEVRCIDRTRTTVTFQQDGAESQLVREIIMDGGTETCPCWNYRGHTGYIRASSEC